MIELDGVVVGHGEVELVIDLVDLTTIELMIMAGDLSLGENTACVRTGERRDA